MYLLGYEFSIPAAVNPTIVSATAAKSGGRLLFLKKPIKAPITRNVEYDWIIVATGIVSEINKNEREGEFEVTSELKKFR